MGMLCLFFVQSSLSLFVATWPGFLYNNFLTFQSGPHSTASCQCWQPVLHCESAWGQDLSLCLAIGHCCPLSALCPALTADCWPGSLSLHMTLSELDELWAHTTPSPLLLTSSLAQSECSLAGWTQLWVFISSAEQSTMNFSRFPVWTNRK